VPVLFGAIVVITLILALKGVGGSRAAKHGSNVLVGALVVALVVLLTLRAGIPWVGIATAIVWGLLQKVRTQTAASRPAEGARASAGPGHRDGHRMTRDEAFQVLGLPAGATKAEILAEYRRLMKKVHPDQGGTTYLATRLNEARDVLLS
jgi:hypothetical protein